MGTKCIDCGGKTKNRSKSTKRCRACSLKYRANLGGRKTGLCKTCGKKLSTKVNKTGMCKICSGKAFTPWNKGVVGLIPWNKGKSIFKNQEEYKIHARIKRKSLRAIEEPVKKIPDRIRTLIRNSIRHNTNGVRRKNSKTEAIIGCSISAFIKHIESQFTDQITWKNYGNGHGKWNIDHILPISSFDLTDNNQIKEVFNYKNCRPMWAIDNIKKGAKILAAAAILTFCVTW